MNGQEGSLPYIENINVVLVLKGVPLASFDARLMPCIM